MNVLAKVAAAALMTGMIAAAQAGMTIPHPVNDYKIVDGQPNPCQMCHQLATATPAQKMQIPQSHQKDGKLAGERFNCLMCHVPAGK
ncbi:MAG: nitrate reductase cytochrome c-type subunit [Sutterella sp.]|nr:nitrate reductase cytochrome c-type subunit [Sutterella sp.]